MNSVEDTFRTKVVGAGLITLDLVVADIESGRFWHRAGGTCGNVLAIMSCFGAKAFAVARIGLDDAGDVLVKDLEVMGVNCHYVVKDPRTTTSRIVEIIRPGKAQTHRFSFKCPACHKRLPRNGSPTADLASQSISDIGRAEVFFFDRISEPILLMARKAKENGALVVFEPSRVRAIDDFVSALTCSDVLKYSRQRLRSSIDNMLSEVSSPPRIVIETLGNQGLQYARFQDGEMGEWVRQGPFDTTSVLDTAGAGDWCTAGFLSSLIKFHPSERWKPESLESALAYGQAIAAASTAFEGALGYIECATYEEINRIASVTIASGRVPGLRDEINRKLRPSAYEDADERGLCKLCLQELE